MTSTRSITPLACLDGMLVYSSIQSSWYPYPLEKKSKWSKCLAQGFRETNCATSPTLYKTWLLENLSQEKFVPRKFIPRKLAQRKIRPRGKVSQKIIHPRGKLSQRKIHPRIKFILKENSSTNKIHPQGKSSPNKIHPQRKFVPEENLSPRKYALFTIVHRAEVKIFPGP